MENSTGARIQRKHPDIGGGFRRGQREGPGGSPVQTFGLRLPKDPEHPGKLAARVVFCWSIHQKHQAHRAKPRLSFRFPRPCLRENRRQARTSRARLRHAKRRGGCNPIRRKLKARAQLQRKNDCIPTGFLASDRYQVDTQRGLANPEQSRCQKLSDLQLGPQCLLKTREKQRRAIT